MTSDRFLPDRSSSNIISSSQVNLRSPKLTNSTNHDPSKLSYQKAIADACSVTLDTPVLSFKSPQKGDRRPLLDIRKQYYDPLKPICRPPSRQIRNSPVRVLDAPGLPRDIHLNLLDWSSKDVVAVMLDQVYCWDANNGAVSALGDSTKFDDITSLSWVDDGGLVALGTSSGDVQIWDVESKSKIRTMQGHTKRVGVLDWNGPLVTSGSKDGEIHYHDSRIPNHAIRKWKNHSDEVCGLKWRRDGALFASGSNDGLVNVWDVRNAKPLFTKHEHTSMVKALSWSPHRTNILATGGCISDQTIRLWNSSSAELLSTTTTASPITSLFWSREYNELLSVHAGRSEQIKIWECNSTYTTPSLRKIKDLQEDSDTMLYSALSNDGQTVVTAGTGEHLMFWLVFERKTSKSSKESSDRIQDVTSSY
ncbi:WD40-repeat-containing domain protein [Paraphysoderma sedebokerense]|nr:WD40-repeat-containing domain protein [Paraphysoderma sedebokerense]